METNITSSSAPLRRLLTASALLLAGKLPTPKAALPRRTPRPRGATTVPAGRASVLECGTQFRFAPCAAALALALGLTTTAFTWQGRLTDGTNAANGLYDLTFLLFNDSTGGLALGTNTFPGTVLSNGTYTATLDFGADAFNGDARWLELALRTVTARRPAPRLRHGNGARPRPAPSVWPAGTAGRHPARPTNPPAGHETKKRLEPAALGV